MCCYNYTQFIQSINVITLLRSLSSIHESLRYTYAHMYTCAHTHTCNYAHVHIHTCIHTHICMHTYQYTTHVQSYACICNICTHAHKCMYTTHMDMHTRIHMHTHIHNIYACNTHTCAFVCIYTFPTTLFPLQHKQKCTQTHT